MGLPLYITRLCHGPMIQRLCPLYFSSPAIIWWENRALLGETPVIVGCSLGGCLGFTQQAITRPERALAAFLSYPDHRRTVGSSFTIYVACRRAAANNPEDCRETFVIISWTLLRAANCSTRHRPSVYIPELTLISSGPICDFISNL